MSLDTGKVSKPMAKPGISSRTLSDKGISWEKVRVRRPGRNFLIRRRTKQRRPLSNSIASAPIRLTARLENREVTMLIGILRGAHVLTILLMMAVITQRLL